MTAPATGQAVGRSLPSERDRAADLDEFMSAMARVSDRLVDAIRTEDPSTVQVLTNGKDAERPRKPRKPLAAAPARNEPRTPARSPHSPQAVPTIDPWGPVLDVIAAAATHHHHTTTEAGAA